MTTARPSNLSTSKGTNIPLDSGDSDGPSPPPSMTALTTSSLGHQSIGTGLHLPGMQCCQAHRYADMRNTPGPGVRGSSPAKAGDAARCTAEVRDVVHARSIPKVFELSRFSDALADAPGRRYSSISSPTRRTGKGATVEDLSYPLCTRELYESEILG